MSHDSDNNGGNQAGSFCSFLILTNACHHLVLEKSELFDARDQK
ncbi:hypothetical protein BFV94_1966 [Alteromonas macleodii]|uniref:Uncharacterized protein n=1 Tax=Alteromonas macleodii TaxID=28108 RepID=A0AB36FVS3_ALTMA|nr:hypothetical protein BFV95_1965 [Alteromonas macleodii]OES32583.1 hypothetical protein BFV94_1966 [Alteromonas macleodii]OES32838.1 hypothetical protein BFV93_1957 [Alteromonas macleodii]OES38544.1 hypothetical protein BFV96_4831 [Alteromonas macleodii]